MTSNGYSCANGNGLANGIMPEGYLSPDTPPKCTWSKRKAEATESPHYHKASKYVRMLSILASCMRVCTCARAYELFMSPAREWLAQLGVLGILPV